MTDPLTEGQKRYLSKHACAWCDKPLDARRCGSIFGPSCTATVIKDREIACLKGYKSRTAEQVAAK